LRKTIVLVALLCSGCASYLAPGGPAPMQELVRGNDSIPVQPTLSLPARVAVVRIQAPKYQSATIKGHGGGAYSVVTLSDDALNHDQSVISQWPQVDSVFAIDDSLLPDDFHTLSDLRLASAKMQADAMLAYTLDTEFMVGGQTYKDSKKVPMSKKAGADDGITVNASAVLIEVRTGYSYGQVSAQATVKGLDKDTWQSEDKLDKARLQAEQQALDAMLQKAAPIWQHVAEEAI